MNKKKFGALVAAIVAALTAFWYTYNSEVEKADTDAPAHVEEVPPAVEAASETAPAEETAAPVEAPVVK